MNIYIVCYEYSDYESHSFRNIKAFMDRDEAELFKIEYEENNKKIIENNKLIIKKRQALIDIAKKKDQVLYFKYLPPEYFELCKEYNNDFDDMERGEYNIEELELV